MIIEVKNNDAVKAYKVLMKKLNKEGLFKELKNRRYYQTKSKKRKEKQKEARKYHRREEARRKKQRENEEKWLIIESKKRARELKRIKQKTQIKS